MKINRTHRLPAYLLTVSMTALILMQGCSPKPDAEQVAPIENQTASQNAAQDATLKTIADDFVRLALAFEVFDANYVDAFTGPESIADDVKANPLTLDAIDAKAAELMARLDAYETKAANKMRIKHLKGDVLALQTRSLMSRGEKLPFDVETRLLYDAVAPQHTEAEFAAALANYDAALPGEGTLAERLEALQTAMRVPPAKVQAVMEAAIKECRARTKAHYNLPDGERFDLEFVTGKSWSAYNWYKGDYKSLIQVNTDLPLTIDRAIILGCHEGYPGHHVFNILAEQDRIKAKGWSEASVVPLFSPAGPIMEGSGNYGVVLAFPGAEKVKFEQEVLYPLAGIDPELAEIHAVVTASTRLLDHAQIHVAREYLDGRMTRTAAVDFMEKYGVRSRKRAEQSVDFIETYRGYVINYALGQDVIADYINRQSAKGQDPWDSFKYILDTPVAVSDLIEK